MGIIEMSETEKKVDPEKIKRDGVKLLEEFSEQLKDVPETDETHYVLDIKNVTREDKKSHLKRGFREKLKKLAPKWEDDYLVAEKA